MTKRAPLDTRDIKEHQKVGIPGVMSECGLWLFECFPISVSIVIRKPRKEIKCSWILVFSLIKIGHLFRLQSDLSIRVTKVTKSF